MLLMLLSLFMSLLISCRLGACVHLCGWVYPVSALVSRGYAQTVVNALKKHGSTEAIVGNCVEVLSAVAREAPEVCAPFTACAFG